MKKVIYSQYDKTLIPSLPTECFPGKIVVILNTASAERAVDFLLSQPILGVDTETRPSFKKGHTYKVSLLQVSTHDTCFLFRLHYIKDLSPIKRLLEDTTVPKIGISLRDDIFSLHRILAFNPGHFIDLQDMVRRFGIEDLSLQKIYANVFGKRISKAERLSNWERDILKDKQKDYAATDAWTCINLYEEFMRMEQTGDYELKIVEKPDSHVQTDTIKEG